MPRTSLLSVSRSLNASSTSARTATVRSALYPKPAVSQVHLSHLWLDADEHVTVLAINDGLNNRVQGLKLQENPPAVLSISSWMMDELDKEAQTTEEQVAVTAVMGAVRVNEFEAALRTKIDELDAGRIATESELADLKSRISKLEDLVRVLTVQRSSAGTPSPMDSPKMAQRLPVNSSDGQTLELNVPKGVPLIPLKEHRAASGVRTTSPAKLSNGLPSAPTTWNPPSTITAQRAEPASYLSAVYQWGGPPIFDSKPLPPAPTARSSSPSKHTEAAAAPAKTMPGSDAWISAPSAQTAAEPLPTSSSSRDTKPNTKEVPTKTGTGSLSWEPTSHPSATVVQGDDKPCTTSFSTWDIKAEPKTKELPTKSETGALSSGATPPPSKTGTSLVTASTPASSTISWEKPGQASITNNIAGTSVTALKNEVEPASKGKAKKWKDPPLFDTAAASTPSLSFANAGSSPTAFVEPKSTGKSTANGPDLIEFPESGNTTSKAKPTAGPAADGKHQPQIFNYITSTSPKPSTQASETVPRVQGETKPIIAVHPPKTTDASAVELRGRKRFQEPAEPERLSVPTPTPSKAVPVTPSTFAAASKPEVPTKPAHLFTSTAQDFTAATNATVTSKENVPPAARSSFGLNVAAPSFTPTTSSPSITRKMTPAMEAMFKAHMARARASVN